MLERAALRSHAPRLTCSVRLQISKTENPVFVSWYPSFCASLLFLGPDGFLLLLRGPLPHVHRPPHPGAFSLRLRFSPSSELLLRL